MSPARWCGATAPGEAYTHSPLERAQGQCQTHRRGNAQLRIGIYPRPACLCSSGAWCHICKGSKCPRNSAHLRQYLPIQQRRMWKEPRHNGFQSTIVPVIAAHQSIRLIISDRSSFPWSFFFLFFYLSLLSQHCEDKGAEQWCQWPFHLQGCREAGLLRHTSCDQQGSRELEGKSFFFLFRHGGLRARVSSQWQKYCLLAWFQHGTIWDREPSPRQDRVGVKIQF